MFPPPPLSVPKGRLLLGLFGLVKCLLLALLLFLACWMARRGLILPFILSGLGSA